MQSVYQMENKYSIEINGICEKYKGHNNTNVYIGGS